MDRLQRMSVFVAVAEAQGFAAAARRLGLSPPAVTRAIAALEAHLGTRLLRRTTRIVRLTDAGARYLEDCRRLLGELDEADAHASGVEAALRGALAVTAPSMFGRLHVIPVLLAFLEAHPAVSAHALLVDRVVDLIEEQVDVAVRIAELQDSWYKAVRVGAVRRVVCASPAFLAAHGTPRTLAELATAESVRRGANATPGPWLFAGDRSVRTRGRFTVSSAEAAVTAAVAGQGLARVLSYQIVDELRSGALVLVLEDHELPPLPISVVHDGTSRRVRAFVDFAVPRLRAAIAAIDPDQRPSIRSPAG